MGWIFLILWVGCANEQGQRGKISSTDPGARLKLMNSEIMPWAKVGCLIHCPIQAPHRDNRLNLEESLLLVAVNLKWVYSPCSFESLPHKDMVLFSCRNNQTSTLALPIFFADRHQFAISYDGCFWTQTFEYEADTGSVWRDCYWSNQEDNRPMPKSHAGCRSQQEWHRRSDSCWWHD